MARGHRRRQLQTAIHTVVMPTPPPPPNPSHKICLLADGGTHWLLATQRPTLPTLYLYLPALRSPPWGGGRGSGVFAYLDSPFNTKQLDNTEMWANFRNLIIRQTKTAVPHSVGLVVWKGWGGGGGGGELHLSAPH